MKKILFPATARPHLARQKLLLDELRKDFEVVVWQPTTQPGSMAIFSIFCMIEFNNFLSQNNNNFDAVLIRGDRYEMAGLAMVSAYKGIPIIHIEGGDLSGAIDNKVRYAVTHLSDYHFCTNEESHQRLIQNGVPTDRVWNFGSLDVEFAKSVDKVDKNIKDLIVDPYILVAYHPIEGEDENELDRALAQFPNYQIRYITSNKDYGRQYGQENYTPEAYVNLLKFASCGVGNSSSFLKEASILGTPIINVGGRQDKRLKPKNVVDVPCKTGKIIGAINYQLQNTFEPDETYYQPETSKRITQKLKEIL